MQTIFTLNAGSSSIKFALFQAENELPQKPIIQGQIDGIGATAHIKIKDADNKVLLDQDLDTQGEPANHASSLALLVDWLVKNDFGKDIVAVGHRVVHGGTKFEKPTLLTEEIIGELAALKPLAPLHQPHNLNGVAAMKSCLPNVPHVACFDTSFHRTQEEVVQRFGIPRKYHDEGVRRYGFHGLSYEFISEMTQTCAKLAGKKIIVAHLGNGSSMCAIDNNRSVASTMGFTALDGLMMGTRCGNIDPGVLLYMMDEHQMDSKALVKLLYKESGLLGVSGISQDMRSLLEDGGKEATEAIQLFCHRIVREIGSLVAANNGVDAIVFTGGIGENAWQVRENILEQLGWLGVSIDAESNRNNSTFLTDENSRVIALRIPTNEEWIIAKHTQSFL